MKQGSAFYIPASRGDSEPIGNFPKAVELVGTLPPTMQRKAMQTTAHYATAHIPPDRALTPDEAADLRMLLSALGLVEYPSNSTGTKHKT